MDPCPFACNIAAHPRLFTPCTWVGLLIDFDRQKVAVIDSLQLPFLPLGPETHQCAVGKSRMKCHVRGSQGTLAKPSCDQATSHPTEW